MTALAVANQKGGVGKTTTTLNLAYTWSSRGETVLVIDCDKQAAATKTVIADANVRADLPTLADALGPTGRTNVGLVDVIVRADAQWGGVDIVPASLDLEDVWKSARPDLVFWLRRAVAETGVGEKYDRVLFDCPPDLGPGMVSAALAADTVIIPTHPERMSLDGVADTVEMVDVLRRDFEPELRVSAIVPLAVDRRVNEHVERLDEVRRLYGELVTRAVIPHRVKSDEASGAGAPAAWLAGDAGRALSTAYGDLAKELDERAGGQ
ncbi:ParA family protein [Jiangella muralis]|uniref:ParA family protein n=1 Tax=Jiangella muralis TaxID=702383 RepID=UPI00069FF926|nr:ParA family protein [Jiangella muralis]